MAIDSTLPVRRAILTFLKNRDAVNVLLPAENIFTSRVPTNKPWPFARYENVSPAVPIAATCLDGQQLDIRINIFTKPREIGGIVVETAEDYISRIIAAVSESLDRRRFQIDRGQMYVAWQGSYIIPDREEADAYQGLVNFRIRTMTV